MASRTDREYESHLRELRQRLLLMAGRVEGMIADAVRALGDKDGELATRTIDADALVNRAEVDIDELCMVILAKWQPLASDLRFITLVLKMVTDLERIGDLAVNICERVIDLAATTHVPYDEGLREMGLTVQTMVRDAIDAFVERDVDKAQSVLVRDDEVDALYTEVFVRTLELMSNDSSLVHNGIHIQSVAKWLERMGDHATNLAEQVVFLTKGKDIRHAGKLPRDRLLPR